MGLAVVTKDGQAEPAWIGPADVVGALQLPKWLRERIAVNPKSFHEFRTERLLSDDEGVIALSWIVDNLWAEVQHLRNRVDELESSKADVVR